MIFDGETFSFRQSWLGTAMRCPEEGRRSMLYPEKDVPSDEAVIGTATHYAIEAYINRDETGVSTLDEMRWMVDRYYDEDPDGELGIMKFTKRNGVNEMVDLSKRLADAWWYDIKPHAPLDGAEAEVQFEVELFNYRGYPIVVKGTVDLAPNTPILWDWKTAGRSYRQKDKQMWAIQPTIYSLAAIYGGIRVDVDYQWPMNFTYGVMVKLKNRCRGEMVTVQRTEAHAAWAVYRIKTFVDMFLDYGTDRPWPLIDEDNYLCSATWCGHYDDCRGKFIPRELDLFGWEPK